jgi:hypothetical protein
MINPGDNCIVTRDVATGAGLAFMTGEQVTVENVSPDPARPDSRYVVYSQIQSKKFLLSDADLRPVPFMHASSEPIVPVPAASPGDVFAGQPIKSTPGDVFAPQAGDSVFAGMARPGTEEETRFISKYWIAGISATVVIIAVTLFFVFSGGAKPPPGVPSDWKKYSSKGVSIWLPPSYQVAYNPEDVDKLASGIKQPGPLFDALGKLMAMNTAANAISGLQPGPKKTGLVSTCNVITEEIPLGMNEDDLITGGSFESPPGLTVDSRSVVMLGKKNAGELLLEGPAGSSYEQLKDVVYIIVNGNMMYQVTFGSNKDDFDRLQPDFQKSAANTTAS